MLYKAKTNEDFFSLYFYREIIFSFLKIKKNYIFTYLPDNFPDFTFHILMMKRIIFENI